MAILAYCITEAEARVEPPHAGLQGKEIQTVVESGLRGFLSDYSVNDPGGKAAVRDAALEFNRALQGILRQAAIIPFRFPTVLADVGEMSAFLRDHANEYREGLSRVRDAVQMEIRLALAAPSNEAPPSSGAEYLRARRARYHELQKAGEELYRQLVPVVRSYKGRQVAGGIRCFFLVESELTGEFMERAKLAEIPSDLTARASGPWPATEFLKDS